MAATQEKVSAKAIAIDRCTAGFLDIGYLRRRRTSPARGSLNLVSFARFRTLSVVPTIPVAGMALILGIDRFMSEARALVNVIGNGVATIVISRTEGELDLARLNAVLEGRAAGADEEAVPADLVDGTPLPSRNQA